MEALDLRLAHGGVVHLEDVEGRLLFEHGLVHADDDLLARIDGGLAACGRLLDVHLGEAGLDGPGHAAERFDLRQVLARPLDERAGEILDVVRTGPRIDRAADAGLLLEVKLGVARDAGREIGGQRHRLVERVGVKRLCLAAGGGQRLEAGAGDVVEGILRGEAPAGGLRVRAERERLGVLRTEPGDHLRPEHAGGAQLGDLHEEVLADAPEEAQARGERIDVDAGLHAGAQIFEAVGQRVGQLQVGRGARLLHVVAGNRDAVELGHALRAVGEDVGDDAHRGPGRVDVGVAHHELLEDVVLDRALQFRELRALLQRGGDVERHDRDDRAVHRHRHRDLAQRDAVEQLLHVQDRVDRHASLADVAHDARVVGVVAAVRREVEGDREAHLARGEIAAVEGVALGGGREAGILAHRPWPRDVHRRVRPAPERREARHRVERLTGRREIGRGVDGLHGDLFNGHPRGRLRRGASRHDGRRGIVEGNPGEIRAGFHGRTPARHCSWARVARTLERRWMNSSKPAVRNSCSRSPGWPARTTTSAGRAALLRRAKTGASWG